MHRDIGQFEEAITLYKRALEIDPQKVEIICNLAIALTDATQLQEAEAACLQALSIKPAYAEAYQQLSDNLHYQQRYDDWDATLDSALKKADLSPDSRNHMLISKAIIAWIDSDHEACRKHLEKASSILSQPVTDKATYSALGYYKFLQALVEYRDNNTSLYKQQDVKAFHMIGDSHCLSYANTVIRFEGEPHRVTPHLIMGCKAWHLSQEKPNICKTSLDLVIEQISPAATVMVSFGEIDCRPDEGIFPAHKKLGTDLATSIKSLTCDYVQSVLSRTKAKKLRVLFYGVPAPNCSLKHLSEEDKAIYLNTVKLFNQFLAKAAAQTGCSFLDPYQETATEQGIANTEFHIDPFHLAPNFLGHLIACESEADN